MNSIRAILTTLLAIIAFEFVSAQTPNDLYQNGNKMFTEGKFEEAIKCYEAIVGQGLSSAELYYNLGNAYFKLNKYPSAIVNYERAHLLNPDDEDILFNLELARTFTVDVIEPLPQFIVSKWVSGFMSIFSTNVWAYIALSAFVIMLCLLCLFWFTSKYQIKRMSFTMGIIFTLLFVISLTFSLKLRGQIINNSHAIIFESAVAAKSSPDNSGKDLFILHSGTKVEMMRTVGDWCEVKIADGNKGWIQKSSFVKI